MNAGWAALSRRRRSLINALIAIAVATTCMCLVAFYQGSLAFGPANRGVTTDATVVRVDHFPRGSKITVEFTTLGGETASAEWTSCSTCSSCW